MKLPATLAALHKREGYHALCITGSEQVVPRWLGDAIGCRPIKTRVSASLEDQISKHLSGASPTFEQRLLFRLWVRNEVLAKRFDDAVNRWLGGLPELRLGYRALPPAQPVRAVYDAAIKISIEENISCWTDTAHANLLRCAEQDALDRRMA